MRAFLTSMLFLGAFGLTAIADDKKPDDKKKDEKPSPEQAKRDLILAKRTFDTVAYGVFLWEKKENYVGCYHLYEGYLYGIMPLLEQRPLLARYVEDQLALASKLKPEEGAFELRKALDMVQLELSGKKVLVEKKPLWDGLGGEKGVRALVKDFVAEVRKDKAFDLTRTGYKFDDKIYEEIEQGLVEIVSEKAGGPLKYTGPRITMLVIGTKITEEEYTALYTSLYKVLIKKDVPKKETEELLGLLASYKSVIVGK